MTIALGNLQLKIEVESRSLDGLEAQLKRLESIANGTGRSIGQGISRGIQTALQSSAPTVIQTSLGSATQSSQSQAQSQGKAIGSGILQGMQGSLQGMQGMFRATFQGAIMGISGAVTNQITGMFQQAGRSAIGFAQDVASVGFQNEQVSASFKTLLKDASAASAMMQQIRELGKTTPFETKDLQESGQMLLSMGVPAGKLIDNLKVMGDLAAGTGSRIKDLAYVFGTSLTTGKIYTRDLNQLATRGIPIYEMMAKQLKVNETRLREMLSQGKVSYNDLARAAQSSTQAGGRYFGAMADQMDSVSGRVSNLQDIFDDIKIKVFEAFKPLTNEMVGIFSQMFGGISGNTSMFDSIKARAQEVADYLKANPQYAQQLGETLNNVVSQGFDALLNGARSLLDYLRDNPTAIQDLITKIQEAIGFVGNFLSGFGQGFAEIFNTLRPVLEQFGIINTASTDSKAMAEAMGKAAAYMITFNAAAGAVLPIITGLLSTVGTIASLFGGLPGIIGGISSAVGGVGAAVGGIGSALSGIASSIPVVALAIGAISITAYNIVGYASNWQDVLLGIQQTWKDLNGLIDSVLQFIPKGIRDSSIFKGLWDAWKTVLLGAISPLMGIASAIDGLYKKSSTFRGIWDGMKSVASGVANAFTSTIGAAIDFLTGKAQQLMGFLGSASSAIGGGMQSVVDAGQNLVSGNGGGSGDGGGARTADHYVGAVLSILEAPTRQGRVDAAQVISNRVGSNFNGYGRSIRDQGFASGQFQPFFTDISKGEIQDRNSAINALQKKGFSAKQAAEALDNFFADIADAGKVNDSQSKVAGRQYFKGVSEYRHMRRGEDFLRQHGENFFHHEDNDRKHRTMTPIGSVFGGGGGNQRIALKDQHGNTSYAHQVQPQHAGKVVVNRTGTKDEHGLEVLMVRTFDKLGNMVGQFTANSGIRSTQGNFGQKARDVARTNNPMPFGDYAIGDTVAAPNIPGYGKTTTILSPQFATARSGIEAHVDGNRAIAPGSAGCLVFKSEAEFAAFMQSVRNSGAKTLRFEEARTSTMSQAIAQQVQPRVLANQGATGDISVPGKDVFDNAEAREALKIARAGEDEKRSLDREKQRRDREQAREMAQNQARLSLASVEDPRVRDAIQQRIDRAQIESKYDDKLEELKQAREALMLKSRRKSEDMGLIKEQQEREMKAYQEAQAAGVMGAAPPEMGGKELQRLQALPNYAKHAQAIDAQIEKLERLKMVEFGVEAAENQRDLKAKQRADERSTRDAATKSSNDAQRRQMEESIALLQMKGGIEATTEAKTMQLKLERFNIEAKLNEESRKSQDAIDDLAKTIDQYQKSLTPTQAKEDPTLKLLNSELERLKKNQADLKTGAASQLRIIDEKDVQNAREINRLLQENKLSRSRLTLESDQQLAGAKATYLRQQGDEFGARDIERQGAIAGENQAHQERMFGIEKSVKDTFGDLTSPEAVAALERLRSNAEQLNQLNLENIKGQFKTLGQTVLDIGKDAFKDFFTSILDGSKSIGDAFKDMVKSIAGQLAKLAVNQIFMSLFGGKLGGGLLGGGGGGLFSGLLGGGAVGLAYSGGYVSGAGIVPNYADGGDVAAIPGSPFSKGYGNISAALQKEGRGAVLAALTPGEIVLSVRQARKFRELGMQRVLNFSAGGTVPGGAIASTSASPTNVNITVPVSVQAGSGIDGNKLAANLAPAFRSIVQSEIERQQRPNGQLS